MPLTERTSLYNREGVDLVWSIHANAGGGNGRCAFYWHSSGSSKQLAELYVDEVKKAGYSTHGNGLHASKPGSWTNLHICRETKMTAVLTENGFMDTDSDFELIFGSKQDEYTDDMARVHVKAIQRFLDEDFKDAKVESAPEQKTKSETTDSGWTKVTGNWTGQTLGRGEYGEPVRQLQNKLASNDPPFYPNKGAENNGVENYYGPNTEDAVERYQSYYGLAVDGLAGKEVYGSLTGGETSRSNKSSGIDLVVDGKWGESTNEALQRTLGTPIDGILSGQSRNSVTEALYGGVEFGGGGSMVVEALQREVGAGVDGLLGPGTVRNLQSYLGTPVDGVLSRPSSMVVEEMQKQLNAGTF